MAFVSGAAMASPAAPTRSSSLALPPSSGSRVSRSSGAPIVLVTGQGGSSPVVRRAFRAIADDHRAIIIRHLSRETGIPATELALMGDDDLAGFSLRKLGKGIAHVAKNVERATFKAVKDTGHAVGAAATSKVGQGILALGLASTGVGIGAAAAIGAGVKGGGELIKKGGNLKRAARGAAIGAATGAASGLVGKVVASKLPGVTDASRRIGNKLLPGSPFKRVAHATAPEAALMQLAPVGVAAGGVTALAPQLTPAALDAGMIPPPSAADLSQYENVGTRTNPKIVRKGKGKRSPLSIVSESGGETSLDTKMRIADATLSAGKRAKGAADSAAGKVDALNKKISKLQAALEKARNAGDALGVQSISDAIGQTQSAIANVSSAVATTGDTLRAAGDAAQGAATGAVAGAAAGGISQWISDNKPLAIGGGIAALALVAVVMGGRDGRQAPSSPRYRSSGSRVWE